MPPERLGRVSDAFTAGASPGSPFVILIEDLHESYGVQKNISQLLDVLATRLAGPAAKAVPFPIAVEGAAGPIDSSLTALFPEPRLKERAADFLMRQGELTGAEDFAIRRSAPALLTGVEDPAYYQLHRDLFRKTLLERQGLRGALVDFEKDVERAQQRVSGRLFHRDLSPAVLVDVKRASEDLQRLIRLVDLQATESDVRQFSPRLGQFVALAGAACKGRYDEATLREILSSSIDYYVLALLRNKPMVENALALAARPDLPSPRIVVLVAGGFHTASITALLRQKSVGYAVITPAVEELSSRDHLQYVERLSGHYLTTAEIMAQAPEAGTAGAAARGDEGLAIGLIGAAGVLGHHFLTAGLTDYALTHHQTPAQAMNGFVVYLSHYHGAARAQAIEWMNAMWQFLSNHKALVSAMPVGAVALRPGLLFGRSANPGERLESAARSPYRFLQWLFAEGNATHEQAHADQARREGWAVGTVQTDGADPHTIVSDLSDFHLRRAFVRSDKHHFDRALRVVAAARQANRDAALRLLFPTVFWTSLLAWAVYAAVHKDVQFVIPAFITAAIAAPLARSLVSQLAPYVLGFWGKDGRQERQFRTILKTMETQPRPKMLARAPLFPIVITGGDVQHRGAVAIIWDFSSDGRPIVEYPTITPGGLGSVLPGTRFRAYTPATDDLRAIMLLQERWQRQREARERLGLPPLIWEKNPERLESSARGPSFLGWLWDGFRDAFSFQRHKQISYNAMLANNAAPEAPSGPLLNDMETAVRDVEDLWQQLSERSAASVEEDLRSRFGDRLAFVIPVAGDPGEAQRIGLFKELWGDVANRLAHYISTRPINANHFGDALYAGLENVTQHVLKSGAPGLLFVIVEDPANPKTSALRGYVIDNGTGIDLSRLASGGALASDSGRYGRALRKLIDDHHTHLALASGNRMLRTGPFSGDASVLTDLPTPTGTLIYTRLPGSTLAVGPQTPAPARQPASAIFRDAVSSLVGFQALALMIITALGPLGLLAALLLPVSALAAWIAARAADREALYQADIALLTKIGNVARLERSAALPAVAYLGSRFNTLLTARGPSGVERNAASVRNALFKLSA